MLAIAAFCDCEIWLMDVKTAFLKEELYMMQPEGFVDPMGINHMALWTRLFTLVQVGDWRKYALEAIIKLLFISLYHDKCLLFMLELY